MANILKHEVIKFEELKAIANSNEKISEYIKKQPLDKLNKLLRELQIDFKLLMIQVKPAEFTQFITKIQLSPKDKKIMPANQNEELSYFVKTFLLAATTFFGPLMVFIGSSFWMLVTGSFITAALCLVAGTADFLALKKEKEELVDQKKILNFQLKILQHINKRKYISLLGELAEAAGIKNKVTHVDKAANTDPAPWWKNKSPHNMLNELIQEINIKNKLYEDKLIQEKFQQLRTIIHNSKIDSIFKSSSKLEHPTLPEWAAKRPLLFPNWWNSNKGEIIRKAFLNEGMQLATSVFTISGFGFAIAKSFNIIAATSLLSTPVGLGLIGLMAFTCFVVVSFLSIYNQYRNAKREHELKVINTAISDENLIKNELENSVANKIKEIAAEIKNPREDKSVKKDTQDINKKISEVKQVVQETQKIVSKLEHDNQELKDAILPQKAPDRIPSHHEYGNIAFLPTPPTPKESRAEGDNEAVPLTEYQQVANDSKLTNTIM